MMMILVLNWTLFPVLESVEIASCGCGYGCVCVCVFLRVVTR